MLYQDEWENLRQRFPESLDGWKLVIDKRSTQRLGCCNYVKKVISLSAWLVDLNGPDHPEVIDTLRHEVAHVLAGPRHNHDLLWKSYAVELGAMPKATVCPKEFRSLPRRKARFHYVAACPACDRKFTMRGKPRKTYACPCYHKSDDGTFEAIRKSKLDFRKEEIQ